MATQTKNWLGSAKFGVTSIISNHSLEITKFVVGDSGNFSHFWPTPICHPQYFHISAGSLQKLRKPFLHKVTISRIGKYFISNQAIMKKLIRYRRNADDHLNMANPQLLTVLGISTLLAAATRSSRSHHIVWKREKLCLQIS